MASKKEQRLDYGFSTGFLNENRDIRSLVDKAIDGEWTMTKFTDELKKTSWWKTRSDTQKQFDIMEHENKAEVASQLEKARGNVRRLAQRLGVNLGSDDVSSIARNWVRGGLSEEAVRYAIGQRYDPKRRPRAGDRSNLGIAGQARHQLAAQARAFGFTMSRSKLDEFTRQVARGTRTVDDYVGYFRERAISLFPSISAELKAGQTVEDVLEPYLNIASQELGLSPAAMTKTSGKWLKPLQYTPKGEKGARVMTNEEWVQELRTNRRYGYDKSANGTQSAARLVTELMQATGRM